MNGTPRLDEVRAAVAGSLLGFIPAGIDELATRHGDAYRGRFEAVLEVLREAFPDRPWPRWAAGGIVEFCRMTLREEARFKTRQHYSRSAADFDAVVGEVYDSAEVMEGYYLVGLLMSYFVWPHHFELLRFFEDAFLSPDDGEVASVAEWGCGHGLFSLLAARRWPGAAVALADVSRHSLAFATRLLAAAGHGGRLRSRLGDILAGGQDGEPPAERLICAELLEHVADPEALLRRVHAGLAPGGRVFLTAAINAPQLDHIQLYRGTGEVFAMVARAGLEVGATVVVSHPASRGRANPPTVVAMVAGHADG